MSTPLNTVRSVLVVDDEPAVRQMLTDYAQTVGCETWEATNGLEALWIIKHHRPALVLLDLTLPRLDGLGTIHHIRKFDPRIRVVVITGDGSAATRLRVESLGLELLVKPFDLGTLDALFKSA